MAKLTADERLDALLEQKKREELLSAQNAPPAAPDVSDVQMHQGDLLRHNTAPYGPIVPSVRQPQVVRERFDSPGKQRLKGEVQQLQEQLQTACAEAQRAMEQNNIATRRQAEPAMAKPHHWAREARHSPR